MQASVFGTRDLRLRADVRRLCRNLTRDFKPGVASVNIIFVTDRQIHALNRRFLRRDRPTDVISFNCDAPLCNPQPPSPPIGNRQSAIYNPKLPGEPRLLGEVYISRDRARAQAREYGVSYASELRRLVLHGLLHLLGLTHAKMMPYETKYLND